MDDMNIVVFQLTSMNTECECNRDRYSLPHSLIHVSQAECVCMCLCVCMFKYQCVWVHLYVCVFVSMCVSLSVCLCTCLSVCMSVFLSVWACKCFLLKAVPNSRPSDDWHTTSLSLWWKISHPDGTRQYKDTLCPGSDCSVDIYIAISNRELSFIQVKYAMQYLQ